MPAAPECNQNANALIYAVPMYFSHALIGLDGLLRPGGTRSGLPRRFWGSNLISDQFTHTLRVLALEADRQIAKAGLLPQVGRDPAEGWGGSGDCPSRAGCVAGQGGEPAERGTSGETAKGFCRCSLGEAALIAQKRSCRLPLAYPENRRSPLWHSKCLKSMVGATGIEPVTPTMST
jgi:hypothetical protein